MIYQKITNLLEIKFHNGPRFITKKCVEVHNLSGNAEERYKRSKQISRIYCC